MAGDYKAANTSETLFEFVSFKVWITWVYQFANYEAIQPEQRGCQSGSH